MSFSKNIIFLSCLFFSLVGTAQNHQFDREAWSRLKEEVDFQKYKQSDDKGSFSKNQRQTEGSKTETTEINRQSDPTIINIGPVVQLIIVVAFIILIVFLIYTLVGGDILSAKSKDLQNDSDISEAILDENVSKTDLERWLEQALAEKNYRLALRIYFLMSIQALDRGGFIKWKKEKTNWEYLDELVDYALRDSFRKISHSFDEIWYGEKILSEDKLVQEISVYKQFLEQIDKHKV